MSDAEGKETLRFARGTRRFEADELSLLRIGDGELVVYAQGVKIDGCNLQLIAAVLREGAAPSMLCLKIWMVTMFVLDWSFKTGSSNRSRVRRYVGSLVDHGKWISCRT